MLHGVADVTAHFSRFRVTEIALDAAGAEPVRSSVMLPAADLLADAKVDAIAWNGTSASWLGIEPRQEPLRGDRGADRHARDDVDARLHRRGPARSARSASVWSRPIPTTCRRRIGEVWAEEAIARHAERHLGLRDNFSFGEVAPATIADMIRAVAADGCDAVVILCTNIDGAALAAALERELGCRGARFGRGHAVADAAARRWRLGALRRWGRIFQTSTVMK